MSQNKTSLTYEALGLYSIVYRQLSSITLYSNGLFAAENVTWVSIKQQKDPAPWKNKRRDREKSTKENPFRSFKSESNAPFGPGPPKGYRWRGRRIRGEINSARPYLAAAPCWVSAEHAVLGKSPFLPLSVTPCPLQQRNLRVGRFAEGYSV